MLGIKWESSARVTSALDHRAIFPAPWLAVPVGLFDDSVFAGLLESLLPLMGLTRVCEFEEGVLGTCHSLLSVGERLRLFFDSVSAVCQSAGSHRACSCCLRFGNVGHSGQQSLLP